MGVMDKLATGGKNTWIAEFACLLASSVGKERFTGKIEDHVFQHLDVILS